MALSFRCIVSAVAFSVGSVIANQGNQGQNGQLQAVVKRQGMIRRHGMIRSYNNHDQDGQLQAEVDANRMIRSYNNNHDQDGQLQAEVDANRMIRSHKDNHDQDGQLQAEVDANGMIRSYQDSQDQDGKFQDVDANGMIRAAQKKSLSSVSSPSHLELGVASSNTCQNIAVFYDGTWNYLNKPCSWPLGGSCETNIAVGWRLASEIASADQLSYYEKGVASPNEPEDDGNFGVGTKRHMLRGYKWLTENYHGCNKIYVFGFSRGGVSARMLQGMIHRVGLARSNHYAEANKHHFVNSDAGSAAAFKADSNKTWPGVKIEYMGLFDTPLRTLLHPFEHYDIASFHLLMTPVVKNFRHAIAMSEYREIYQTNEFWVDPATQSEQAWFVGTHTDVGGGRNTTGNARISAGWIFDKAVELGLKLPPAWSSRDTMAIDLVEDIQTEGGLDTIQGSVLMGVNLETTFSLATVRNPAKCRAEANKTHQKILFHQSVRDRMDAMRGWVPLPYCCSGIKADMTAAGIEYVTNPHYKVAKGAAGSPSPHPQWFKITIGRLSNAPVPGWWSSPDYYLKVFSWHSAHPLPAGAGAGIGCCTRVTKYPPKGSHAKVTKYGSWWHPSYKADQNFKELSFVLPHEGAMADKVVIELLEADILTSDDYIGRAEISYTQLSSNKEYDIGSGAKLEVKVETVSSDEEAAPLLGAGANDPAACKWLELQSGFTRHGICNAVSSSLVSWLQADNAKSCEGFIEDTRTGVL